ncbi:hypothetical protein Tco_1402213 [Tanacetum coccineum]
MPTQTSSVLHNDTVSSCSASKVQEKTQLSRSRCMNSLREVKSQFKFLTETLQDFSTMPIFKRTFSQDLDLLEQHLTKYILSQTDCNTTMTKLITKFENAFNLEFKERTQKYIRFNAQSFQDAMIFVIQNTCSEKEDSNSETASNKSEKQNSLDSATKDIHEIKYKMSKAKKRCMTYFRSLHSHIQVLSKEDLKGTRIEHGFKRAFMSLFGQDDETFTSMMLLNFTLDYDSQMTDKYFVEYTGIEVKHFRDTLLQHMGNVKKSVAERTRHQRQYDRRVNKKQMQTQESKVDTSKALDADLVVIESSGTESEVQDDSSMSDNDTDANDAYIRPIYDEEPMAEVQLTVECNIFAIRQKQTEQPKIINEGRVDQYTEKCQVKSPLLNSSPDNKTIEFSNQSLESENIFLKKTVTQFQKDFAKIWRRGMKPSISAQNLLM